MAGVRCGTCATTSLFYPPRFAAGIVARRCPRPAWDKAFRLWRSRFCPKAFSTFYFRVKRLRQLADVCLDRSSAWTCFFYRQLQPASWTDPASIVIGRIGKRTNAVSTDCKLGLGPDNVPDSLRTQPLMAMDPPKTALLGRSDIPHPEFTLAFAHWRKPSPGAPCGPSVWSNSLWRGAGLNFKNAGWAGWQVFVLLFFDKGVRFYGTRTKTMAHRAPEGSVFANIHGLVDELAAWPFLREWLKARSYP